VGDDNYVPDPKDVFVFMLSSINEDSASALVVGYKSGALPAGLKNTRPHDPLPMTIKRQKEGARRF